MCGHSIKCEPGPSFAGLWKPRNLAMVPATFDAALPTAPSMLLMPLMKPWMKLTAQVTACDASRLNQPDSEFHREPRGPAI